MKKYLFILFIFTLSGCATTYPKITNLNNSAFVELERHINGSILGSFTGLYKVKKTQQCYDSYVNSQILILQDKGNPLNSNVNENGLLVKSGEYLRILVNSVSGQQCQTIIGFNPKKGEKYKIVAHANIRAYNQKCSVELYEWQKNNSTYKQINLAEYNKCGSR